MTEIETNEIKESDLRISHHKLLIAQGYALDRQFEKILGLRVYRKNLGENRSNHSVDVFRDGTWGKYGEVGEYLAGNDFQGLEDAFSAHPYRDFYDGSGKCGTCGKAFAEHPHPFTDRGDGSATCAGCGKTFAEHGQEVHA